MADTTKPAQVAENNDEKLSFFTRSMEAFGQTHAETVLVRLTQLLHELDSYSATRQQERATGSESKPGGLKLMSPLSFALDALVAAFVREAPALSPLVRDQAGCAVFAAVVFGTEVINPADAEVGWEAQEAFMVARAYLAAPMNSGARNLLLAAAVAALRFTETEAEEGDKADANKS